MPVARNGCVEVSGWTVDRIPSPRMGPLIHGEQHVKNIYSTVAIDKRGHALNPVRGYSLTGEETNACVPWL